jgi:hypothetical protein
MAANILEDCKTRPEQLLVHDDLPCTCGNANRQQLPVPEAARDTQKTAKV